MEAEKDLNEKRFISLHGQPIKIGEEVQLYHVYSRSYLKATREKTIVERALKERSQTVEIANKSNKNLPNNEHNGGSKSTKEMFAVRLSKAVSSSTHYAVKINPYLNSKKDGENI